jgi:hypothetical protein
MKRGGGEKKRLCGGGIPCGAKPGTIPIMLKDGV